MGVKMILVHLIADNEVIGIPTKLIQAIGEFHLAEGRNPKYAKFHEHTKSYIKYAKDRVEYPYQHEAHPVVVGSTTIYLRENIDDLIQKLEG